MNIYTQGLGQKRAANSKVVEIVLPDAKTAPAKKGLAEWERNGSQLRLVATAANSFK